MTKTTTRGPWPGAPKPTVPATKAPGPRGAIDLARLQITDDPVPTKRAAQLHHYDPIFEKLKPGQRLMCPPDRARVLANNLKDYLKRTGKPGTAKSCERYEKDGLGGVWWVAEK